MAYMNFSDALPLAANLAPARTETVATARFTGLEWSVIALARQDGLDSLEEPGRLSRLLGLLFGFGSNRKLADAKLETLRRLAVHGWRDGHRLSPEAQAEARRVGYTPDHVELMLSRIAPYRIGRGREVLA
ncbi:hypothetical protein [Sphingomonas montanisoli]|uniref:Uncharacterized protein n=1 Tax=Sphingomonas montanisoli TaxID=2606412 RepID=A0A5D9C9M3_9SPHN|nr:hypothetical protein [Sphingomonas montanisoli]TZG27977.1 hypothetical protein FYJ91_10610 [Sphingomonas montanisoli]